MQMMVGFSHNVVLLFVVIVSPLVGRGPRPPPQLPPPQLANGGCGAQYISQRGKLTFNSLEIADSSKI